MEESKRRIRVKVALEQAKAALNAQAKEKETSSAKAVEGYSDNDSVYSTSGSTTSDMSTFVYGDGVRQNNASTQRPPAATYRPSVETDQVAEIHRQHQLLTLAIEKKKQQQIDAERNQKQQPASNVGYTEVPVSNLSVPVAIQRWSAHVERERRDIAAQREVARMESAYQSQAKRPPAEPIQQQPFAQKADDVFSAAAPRAPAAKQSSPLGVIQLYYQPTKRDIAQQAAILDDIVQWKSKDKAGSRRQGSMHKGTGGGGTSRLDQNNERQRQLTTVREKINNLNDALHLASLVKVFEEEVLEGAVPVQMPSPSHSTPFQLSSPSHSTPFQKSSVRRASVLNLQSRTEPASGDESESANDDTDTDSEVEADDNEYTEIEAKRDNTDIDRNTKVTTKPVFELDIGTNKEKQTFTYEAQSFGRSQ